MTDDSNGESTFEFVERKTDESSTSGEIVKTDSFSSLSSSTSLLMPLGISTSTGNLLSNVAPPSALPSFISNSGTLISERPSNLESSTQKKFHEQEPTKSMLNTIIQSKPLQQETHQTTVTSIITPSTQNVPTTIPSETVTQDSGMVGVGLLSWVKETVVNSNVLSKVAEKAKNSVNTMITTLDPQMREFIYSGGDMEIIVASDKDVKISPVRQAFQTVFGKATVTGVSVETSAVAAQPVGFAAGVKGAEERINSARNIPTLPKDIPIIAVENFLLEVGEDKWYDLGVILLNDPKRNVNLQTFTQMTPVPSQIVTMAQEATPEDYPLKWSGLSVTVGSLMANSLQVNHNEWHHALTGISRRDIILLAVQSLAGIYKNTINPV
ncbi:protein PRRC1 isoform X1 [Apis cerana]|uniref:Dolichyl-diphosphooligosaccharide--protein glycosyltransferase subunit 4 isoform X1 n=1 Tax=Apis mellifera TaxID=7460 RepID=A0A7M7IF20_APIME|nr:dolichyl-diphosphooligosaccharide--protein glycosyltransferase subunit 4 isoform X1 [Apis mellifera]XP_016910216.1 protein PRRC1 isoform X1 [Apis cerana]KAG9434061.1 protein PRRC1 isoform X1 [Apis mellifera carnica]|eukprot:XP_016767774.2 dolichyl-diphosphooligosaccharide--protein glycosyltransferase subunit 4 isoform X1 [Apis mellifera]